MSLCPTPPAAGHLSLRRKSKKITSIHNTPGVRSNSASNFTQLNAFDASNINTGNQVVSAWSHKTFAVKSQDVFFELSSCTETTFNLLCIRDLSYGVLLVKKVESDGSTPAEVYILQCFVALLWGSRWVMSTLIVLHHLASINWIKLTPVRGRYSSLIFNENISRNTLTNTSLGTFNTKAEWTFNLACKCFGKFNIAAYTGSMRVWNCEWLRQSRWCAPYDIQPTHPHIHNKMLTAMFCSQSFNRQSTYQLCSIPTLDIVTPRISNGMRI